MSLQDEAALRADGVAGGVVEDDLRGTLTIGAVGVSHKSKGS